MSKTAIDICTPLVPSFFYNSVRPVVERTQFLLRKKKMLQLHSQFIRSGDLVFDIGAHEGYFAELFLALGARVICVEPQARCIAVLERKFGRNPNVVIVPKGLNDTATEMVMHICKKRPGIATFSDEWKTEKFGDQPWDGQIKVPTTTLGSLVDEFGTPAFCKIDVEGWELNVLLGLTKKIKAISFEFAHEFLGRAKKCCDHLSTLGTIRCDYSLSHDFVLQGRWTSPELMFQQMSRLKAHIGDIYVTVE